MANIYIFLDARTTLKKDGSHPLRMAVTHNHKSAYESLTVSVRKDEWDKEGQCVIKRPDKKFLNVMLRKKLADAETCLERISTRPDFDRLEAADILRMAMRGSDTVDSPKDLDYLLPTFNEYLSLLKNVNTKSSYRCTLKNIVEFTGTGIDNLRFKDINITWLRQYQNWLYDTKGMGVNGANVYLRNLRTVFNYALRNEITSARYPFKDIDMSTIEPDKRTIPFKDFIKWVAAPADEWCIKYRDLFVLSFLLCGIRPVDILNATWDNVQDGRLVYYPQKLRGRTKMSIKIEPEAWEIIEKYKGEEHLLNFLDSRTDYRQFCKLWNKGLKSIKEIVPFDKKGQGEESAGWTKARMVPVISYITAYYSRSCWATYCYNELDIPMDVISSGLGHKSGLRVTNFYVKRDMGQVDKANRKLIDLFKKSLEEYVMKNPHDLLRQRG